MAASVLYFGPDECNRVQVLESTGYRVREYHKLEELKSALESPPQPAAVVVSGFDRAYAHPVVEIIHSRAGLAPIILFPSRNEPELEKSADLVIPPLTPPQEWLQEIAELIERSRALQQDAIGIQEQSATLIQQSVAIRSKAAADRASSVLLREHSAQQKKRVTARGAAEQKKLK